MLGRPTLDAMLVTVVGTPNVTAVVDAAAVLRLVDVDVYTDVCPSAAASYDVQSLLLGALHVYAGAQLRVPEAEPPALPDANGAFRR